MIDPVPIWLGGQEVSTSETFDVVSPVTGELLYQAAAASDTDVQAAISSSAKAFATWAKSRPATKRDILLRAADCFAARKEECWKILRQETGTERGFFEVTFNQAIEMCKDVAGLIQVIGGRAPILAEAGRSAIVNKEPLGVVLGIAPWNAPFALGVRACIQPLACGNTVILKGSELSPKTFWIISSILHEAGLPAGCLNTIYHRPGEDAIRITNTLISSPSIRKISFTGSTFVGSAIAAIAGKHLKPVLMELGGKAPAIICDDANLDMAAEECATGAFLNSGQICMSTERIVVAKNIATLFIEKLKVAVDKKFGVTNSLPVVITKSSIGRNELLISDAIQKGAVNVAEVVSPPKGKENKMPPVILRGITSDMDIYYKESFGPIVSIIEVDTDEEAIEIANDTEYGLTSAVFTENLQRGFKIAGQILAGAVHINGMTIHDENSLPHGGVKKSGFGRNNNIEGLNEWLQTKTITWKD